MAGDGKDAGKLLQIKEITLKDGTKAFIHPVSSPDEVPLSLLQFLHALFNREILKGDTYPHLQQLSFQEFKDYWFSHFVVLILTVNLSDLTGSSELDNINWDERFLGTNYIKPNYIGRCSHICNSGFLVNFSHRNKGVGRQLALNYLEWAPQLGYTYSVFNLVFETNVASVKLWDSLDFQRIGYVPEAGELNGFDKKIGAIIFGKKLTAT